MKQNECLAGAVARQFNEDREKPDTLEIFDYRCHPPEKVSEILLASSDAPLFFKTPCEIGQRGHFIDGGVGGNLILLSKNISLYSQVYEMKF